MWKKWGNGVKKVMLGILLGAVLTAPVGVASAEEACPEIFQPEEAGEQDGMSGSLPEDAPAAGELPGSEGNDGTGIMPCEDLDMDSDKDDQVKNSNN